MDGGVLGAIGGLGVFVAGLVFHAGVMTNRLSVVERDQERLYRELRTITSTLDEVKGMIRGDAP